MKTKLTNMLRGKERKKRKNGYAKLIEVDEEDLYTLKINYKEKRNSRKSKQRNKFRTNIISLKNLKLKIVKKRKEKEKRGKKKRGKLHTTAKGQRRGRGL